MNPSIILAEFRAKSWFLLRYAVAGAIGGAIQTVVLYVWVTVLDLTNTYLWGVVVGFAIALCASFVLQKYWTFRDRSRDTTHRQFVFYTIFALCSLGLNTFLLYESKMILESYNLDFFRVWYILAEIAIVAGIAGMSFVANYLITFRAHAPGSGEIVE